MAKKKFHWISICTTLLFRRNGEEITLLKFRENPLCLSGLSRPLCFLQNLKIHQIFGWVMLVLFKNIIVIYKLSDLLNLPFGQWSQVQTASEMIYDENILI